MHLTKRPILRTVLFVLFGGLLSQAAIAQTPDFWPHEVVLTKGKGMVINGHPFVEGDTISFHFDSESLQFIANGILIRDYRPEPPLSKEAPDEEWIRKFSIAFFAQDSTLSNPEKAKRALQVAGEDFILPNPIYGRMSVDLCFKESGSPLVVSYPLPGKVWTTEMIEKQSEDNVRLIEKLNAEEGMFVWNITPIGEEWGCSDVPKRLRVIEKARKKGKLLY